MVGTMDHLVSLLAVGAALLGAACGSNGGGSDSAGSSSEAPGDGGSNGGSDGGGTNGGGSGNNTGGHPPTVDELGCHEGATGTVVDARDGQAYCTTEINGKTWMAENLRFLPAKGTHGCPDDEQAQCSKYGSLYYWSAVVGVDDSFLKNQANLEAPVRGICMEGWHVPSQKEYLALLDFVKEDNPSGGLDFEGKLGSQHLRSTSDDWEQTPTTVKASNKYGFWGLPAGNIGCIGDSCNADGLGYKANFWSSTELSDTHAVALELRSDEDARVFDQTNNSNPKKQTGRSLRCLKD